MSNKFTITNPSYDRVYDAYAWRNNNLNLALVQGEGITIPSGTSDSATVTAFRAKAPRLQLRDDQGIIGLSDGNPQVVWAVKRPDKSEDMVACNIVTASDGIIEIPITASVTQYAGEVLGEIRIITSNGVVKFYGINATVGDGVSDDAAAKSARYSALLAALQKVVTLDASGIATLDTLIDGELSDNGSNPVASGVLKTYLKSHYVRYESVSDDAIDTANDQRTVYIHNVGGGVRGLVFFVGYNNYTGVTTVIQYRICKGGRVEYRTGTVKSPITTPNTYTWDKTYSENWNPIGSTQNIQDAAVTTAKVADGAVTEPKIANSAVTTSKINDEAVTTEKIKASAVTSEKLSTDAVTTSKIKNGAVTSAKIASGAVDTWQLADAAVTNDKLDSNSVNTLEIVDGAITRDKMSNNSVGSTELLNSSVTTAKIVDAAVTTEKIADGAVTVSKMDIDDPDELRAALDTAYMVTGTPTEGEAPYGTVPVFSYDSVHKALYWLRSQTEDNGIWHFEWEEIQLSSKISSYIYDNVDSFEQAIFSGDIEAGQTVKIKNGNTYKPYIVQSVSVEEGSDYPIAVYDLFEVGSDKLVPLTTTYTINGTSWVNNQFVMSGQMSAVANGRTKADVTIDQTVYNQLVADGCCGLYISTDLSGSLPVFTMHALGNAPTATISVQVTLSQTETI